MKKKRLLLGKLLMLLGGAAVVCGLMLFGYNFKLERTAEKASASALLALEQKIEDNCAADRSKVLQQLEVDGARYLGILTIPALDLTLPVQTDWDYEKLLTAPCVYTGSVQDGNLVLLAHNYQGHFGRIDHLRQGDEVKLTDARGNVFHYSVEEVFVLEPVAVDEMTDSGYDLSLFTCTYGGKARITVRCSLQNVTDRALDKRK